MPGTDLFIDLFHDLPGNRRPGDARRHDAGHRHLMLEPLANALQRVKEHRDALERVENDFDIILIDCPPSVGIYTVNAFRAASEVLVPMTAEFFALIGVSMLFDSLERIRKGLKHQVTVTGIVPTRVTRTTNSRQVVEQIDKEIGARHRIFTSIPEAVAVRSAAAAGQPVTEFSPDSPASVAYRKLAQEVLNGA